MTIFVYAQLLTVLILILGLALSALEHACGDGSFTYYNVLCDCLKLVGGIACLLLAVLGLVYLGELNPLGITVGIK